MTWYEGIGRYGVKIGLEDWKTRYQRERWEPVSFPGGTLFEVLDAYFYNDWRHIYVLDSHHTYHTFRPIALESVRIVGRWRDRANPDGTTTHLARWLDSWDEGWKTFER